MTGRTDNPRRNVAEGMRFARWAAGDGWTLRSFSLEPEGKPRGSLLFLGGRGDFIEKYLEAIAHWRASGWRVEGFDWRGQGGSGRMLTDRSICHLDSFDPLLEDLAGFAAGWKARSPAPHVAVAHSMGGHLLLRLLAERDGRLDAGVLAAPMLGIAARPIPPAALALTARLAAAAGLGRRRLWRGDIGNVGGRMTSCPERQADKVWWKTTCPEIASGPPSWGWLRAAFASIRRMEAVGFGRIETPLLVLASRRDPVIDLRALRRAAARMPGAELQLFPGTGHELLRETDSVRLAVLGRIDRFLARSNAGGGTEPADVPVLLPISDSPR